MTINRAPFNALVDDDGSGQTGSRWNKNAIKDVVLDPIDALFASTFGGLIDLSGGVGQIKFPASPTPSGDNTTLDCYKEFSWTPIIGGATSESGQVYSNTAGYYVKIGRMVIAPFYINMTTKGTITGNILIKGLPFASNSNSNYKQIFQIGVTNLVTNWLIVVGELGPNTTNLLVKGMTAGGASGPNTTALVPGDLQNNITMAGTAFYMADQ